MKYATWHAIEKAELGFSSNTSAFLQRFRMCAECDQFIMSTFGHFYDRGNVRTDFLLFSIGRFVLSASVMKYWVWWREVWDILTSEYSVEAEVSILHYSELFIRTTHIFTLIAAH